MSISKRGQPLSTMERKVYEMRTAGKMTNEQVALGLGASVLSVRLTFNRALRKLGERRYTAHMAPAGSALTGLEFEVVALRDQGLSVAAIAAKLGRGVEAIGSTLRRARRKQGPIALEKPSDYDLRMANAPRCTRCELLMDGHPEGCDLPRADAFAGKRGDSECSTWNGRKSSWSAL